MVFQRFCDSLLRAVDDLLLRGFVKGCRDVLNSKSAMGTRLGPGLGHASAQPRVTPSSQIQPPDHRCCFKKLLLMLLLCHGSLMVCSIRAMRGSGRALAGIPQSSWWGHTTEASWLDSSRSPRLAHRSFRGFAKGSGTFTHSTPQKTTMPHLRRESEVFSNQVDGGTVAKMVSLQNVSPACFDTIPISAFYLGSCIAELLLLFYISVHTCNIYIYIYMYILLYIHLDLWLKNHLLLGWQSIP